MPDLKTLLLLDHSIKGLKCGFSCFDLQQAKGENFTHLGMCLSVVA
jgi:hypothetical protein